eukprot:s172_g16.t1
MAPRPAKIRQLAAAGLRKRTRPPRDRMEFPRDLPDLEALETPAENSCEEEEEGVCMQKEQEAPVPHETLRSNMFLKNVLQTGILSWTATEERFPTESALDSVRRLRKELPPKPIVCILGGTAISKPDTQETAGFSELASARVGSRAVFMTGGMAGVQKAFADSCPEHMPLFHLTPFGEKSNFDMGQDVHAGASLAERKDVYGLLGDLYITIEGGPGVAGEAKAAAERGAAVIPLIRSGGASAGMFAASSDFPAGALNKPAWALEPQWSLLSKEEAANKEVATAMVLLVECYLQDYGGRDAHAKQLYYSLVAWPEMIAPLPPLVQ